MPDQTLLSAEQIAEIKSGIRPLYSDLHNTLCDTALSAIALRERLEAAEPFELLAEQFENQRDDARSKLEWWASACQSQQTRADTAEAELSRLRAPVESCPRSEAYWCIEMGRPAKYYGIRANSPFPEWSTNHELAWHFSTKEQAELMKASLLRSRNYGPHDLRVCDHVNILYELPPARPIAEVVLEDHTVLLKYLDSISWWPDTPEPASESTDDMATQAATAIRTLAATIRERDESIANLIVQRDIAVEQLREQVQVRDARIAALENSHELRLLDIMRLEARIDSLMMEYCPNEMTEFERARWAENQVGEPLTTEQQSVIDAALTQPARGEVSK